MDEKEINERKVRFDKTVLILRIEDAQAKMNCLVNECHEINKEFNQLKKQIQKMRE